MAALATLEAPSERSEHYASRSKAKTTIKTYAVVWCDFLQSGEPRQVTHLTASEQTGG